MRARRWQVLTCLVAWLLAPALSLAGPPSVVDPFKGMPELSGLQETGAKIRDLQDQRVALLYTENTRRHFAWSERNADEYTLDERSYRMAELPYRSLKAEAYATAPLATRLLEPLRRKSRSVTEVPSFQAWDKGPYDTLALLDVTFVDANWNLGWIPVEGYRSGMWVRLYLKTRDGRTTVVDARVERRPEMDGYFFIRKVKQIRGEATTQFTRSLDDLLVGPELPPPEPAPPVPERRNMLSLAEQLKLIEADLEAGRISVEEAQMRRNRALGTR